MIITVKQKVVFSDREGNRQRCKCGCETFRRVKNRRDRYKCSRCGRIYKTMRKKEKE